MNGSVMNMVCYESGLFSTGLLWMGLLWTWSVLNGLLWMVCYERVCFEWEPVGIPSGWMVRPPWHSPNHQGDMGLFTRPLWSHLQWDRWHVGFELLQLHSTQLVPFWPKADRNKVMERSAHHINPILGRKTPPHLPWYRTWIITLQHQGRTCQSNPQPTAHWQHLLLHSFDAFGGAC